MKITKVKIINYRNLDGLEISLAEDCNFIVGENNLGKSNFLSLLNTLLTSRTFKIDDFKDPKVPIEIHLRIKLATVEIGQFEDLFELDDPDFISIVGKQENIDEFISFCHLETDTFIPLAAIRGINFVHYDSLRSPTTEINFDKGRGVGRFLKKIIARYLQANDLNDARFIDDEQIKNLLASVNATISKIRPVKEFGIVATPDNDPENILSSLIKLKDQKGDDLMKSGYGLQFLILVTLSIIEKLQNIYEQRGEKGVFEDEGSGVKSISLVLGLDEPEIHLHPFMQRSLIKYLNSIINNANSDFQALAKELFGIDQFNGQIIVVTHSPNIILNEYTQISRVCLDRGNLKVFSGCNLNLDSQLQKHLLLQFPFIKEAFFSRCVIFVEGDSEFGSFPYFAQKLSIEFDDLGICVIKANGDSVPQLMSLVKHFGIPSVGITDRDDGTRTITESTHFETNLRNFEDELVSLVDAGKENVLRVIVNQFDAGAAREMQMASLNKWAFGRYQLVSSPFSQGLRINQVATTDVVNLKAYYLTWFSSTKSRPLGMLIGQVLAQDEIPTVYKTVLTTAEALATNV